MSGETRVHGGQTSNSELLMQNLESWYGVPVPPSGGQSTPRTDGWTERQVGQHCNDAFEPSPMGATMAAVLPNGEAYLAQSTEVDRARNDAIDGAFVDRPSHPTGPAAQAHFALDSLADLADLVLQEHGAGAATSGALMIGGAVMSFPMIFEELAHAHEAGEADGQRMVYQGGYARGAADALFDGAAAPDTSTPAGRGYARGAAYVQSLSPERREALRDGLEARNEHDHGYVWDRDTAALTLELAAERHMNSCD